MKQIVRLTAILLALLALASCYWRPDFSSGGLTVDVSGIKPRVEGEVFRIYLIADGLLFSTGGGAPFVAEVPVTYGEQQKIAIDGLPVGPKYKAIVGRGSSMSGVFYPYSFGESPQFVITPNADTVVTIPYESMFPIDYTADYSPDLLGRNVTGIIDQTYGSMVAAESSRLYETSFDPYGYIWSSNSPYDLAGYQINGLSRGDPSSSPNLYTELYLDTTNGILPFEISEGLNFDTTFTGSLTGSRDIRRSGSFPVVGTDVDYAIFFRRNSGLGGAYVPLDDYYNPAAWRWVNLDVAGVSDLAVSQYNAYFAAEGTAFVLPPAFLLDTTPTLAEHRIDPPEFASLPSVQSIGFRPSGVAAGSTLTLGTTNGVWRATVDESTAFPFVSVSAGPTQIVETAGDSIERIAISSYISGLEAYLSRYYLYILKYGSTIYKVPFFAVIPGRATGMAWDYNGTLYIAGTEGLAAIYVGVC